MILGFSTELKAKPTFFPEKILCGLFDHQLISKNDWQFYTKHLGSMLPYSEKYHTIRQDTKDRWKIGMNIDFFINVRKKNMFRFAPVLPVVSIQTFQIIHYDNTETVWEFPHLKYAIRVDKRRLEPSEIEILALNDGFDSVEDFLNYFNRDFKGKIIHWTDLKY